MSAIARIKLATVFPWGKESALGSAESGLWAQQAHPEPSIPASIRKTLSIGAQRPSAKVISFDEIWICLKVRRGEKRRSVRTAVVEEADGRRWVDFKVGDRGEKPLVRLRSRRRPQTARIGDSPAKTGRNATKRQTEREIRGLGLDRVFAQQG